MKAIATITALLALLAMGVARIQAQSLLSNGDFEKATKAEDWPDDWPRLDGVTWEQEDGNHFLRLHARPEKMLTVYRVIDVKPDHKAYAFSFRARAIELKRGKANWHDGRIILDFKDASGAKLKGGPGHPNFHGTTKDGWKEVRLEFLVPEGATKLEIMPAMFQVASGTLDLDDLYIEPIDPAPVQAAKEAAEAKRAAEIAARAARVKPQVPVTPPDQLPPMLHVEGNKVFDANGNEVWLQGVAIPSMEWSAGGENILKSVTEATENWNAKVIRLGIREHFWAGTGPYQNDGGAAYRQLVDDVVNLASSKGVYVVLDLHCFRAPEQKHADFWKQVAEKYKNHPAVLFELFNEPHDVSWDVWKNGGFVSDKKRDETVIAENNEKLRGFHSIGMQALVDTVRNTGAKNIVIVGGLDWSYDLSGVINGYALDDRGGNGIMYSSHVYPWKSKWQQKFLDVAEKYPLFIGECGAPKERLEFIPESQHEDPSTWVPDFLGLVQKHKLHWTAWSFHPKASPVLLEGWDYTPTPYWGEPAKRALAGEKFEMKRMR